METLEQKTIGSFVAEDYRTASIFQKHKIDFCCRGGQTITEACDRKKVNKELLLEELKNIMAQDGKKGEDFNNWSLDELAEYIEKNHHNYIEDQIPVLLQFLDKLCKVHGGRHPELFEINEEFTKCAEELSVSLREEQQFLFPYIKEMERAKAENKSFQAKESPLNTMKREYQKESDCFKKIADLSDNFTPPADGCTTYRVAFQMLNDFDESLRKQIHLKNNILFPKAIELEKSL
ncbi:iron-sulfur cluster repair di-iron protein [Weeksellaceae bacterium TAE3-ERU29]|nr:iron-sulfur cluster repair di-iron protein [Weeksellaceae bacterium TAE3-ERU29]